MPRGRPANPQRRRRIAALRATGLTYEEIGKRLGISYQSVQQALQRAGNARLVPIRCRECGAVITRMRTVANNNGPVYCLDCLPGAATFGQRLKARRLAKGISLMALSEQTGIVWTLLSKYERDVVEPKCRTLMKLIGVLGMELMLASRPRSS
jgi:transcriptional regulator with XRE-family HTH domain